MRRLILAYTLVAPVIFLLLVWRAPWTSLGILALSHALVLYPTLRPNAQWLGPVFTAFSTSARELWLTIDDGPTSDTRQLLDLLDRHGVPATFFVKGSLAAASPDAVREILQRGHTIGNHSQTHPSGSFWCLPPNAIREQVDRCSDVIAEITGSSPQLFRAPVGMKNPFVHPAIEARGMRLVGWSARAFDAVRSDVEYVVRKIRRTLRPGAIIVMHQGREWSLRAIEAVIEAAKQDGYTFVIPSASRLKTKR